MAWCQSPRNFAGRAEKVQTWVSSGSFFRKNGPKFQSTVVRSSRKETRKVWPPSEYYIRILSLITDGELLGKEIQQGRVYYKIVDLCRDISGNCIFQGSKDSLFRCPADNSTWRSNIEKPIGTLGASRIKSGFPAIEIKEETVGKIDFCWENVYILIQTESLQRSAHVGSRIWQSLFCSPVKCLQWSLFHSVQLLFFFFNKHAEFVWTPARNERWEEETALEKLKTLHLYTLQIHV